jgi:predicted membrane protein
VVAAVVQTTPFDMVKDVDHLTCTPWYTASHEYITTVVRFSTRRYEAGLFPVGKARGEAFASCLLQLERSELPATWGDGVLFPSGIFAIGARPPPCRSFCVFRCLSYPCL